MHILPFLTLRMRIKHCINAHPVIMTDAGRHAVIPCALRGNQYGGGTSNMEMSESIPRPVQAIRPVRGPHGGWQKQEIDALRQSIEEAEKSGESLRSVFERLGMQLGRKPNSIRNFYYAQVRAQEENGKPRTLPFETFSPEEVEQLIERVLTARAQGMSVRACVRSLAGGDRTRMLRYQNKYRSTIRTRPELVRRVMQRLSEEGTAFVSPYVSDEEETPRVQTLARLKKRAKQSGDPQLEQLFSSLDHLMDMALSHTGASDGAPRPTAQDSEALRRADRLSAHCDMLRIALDDEQTRRGRLQDETEGMITLIKEYIALPDADRLSHCGAFCQQAAARLSAVECALMPGQK